MASIAASDPIRVAVVDDRRLARIAARAILDESPGLTFVGEASTLPEALSIVRQTSPDVVLVDVEMPPLNGPATARALRERYPDLVLLAWTVSDDGEDLLRMFEAGCNGYVLKESGPAELQTAIRVALRNETAVPRRMVAAVLRQAADYVPSEAQAEVSLTPSELQVLKLMAKGLATKQIASRLGVMSSSIETHIRNLYRKLEANNRAAAIGYALKLRLLTVHDL